MWNKKRIIPPLICNMKTIITASNQGHFKSMATIMTNLTHLLSDISVLKSELHILSKMIYKKNSQRRREKTLQGLKRIESCVERFCAFEDIKYLEDISSSLNSVDLSDNSTYMPSKQMLEFVLVRLMGLAALLTQTTAYCVHTFLTVQHDLEIGIFIPQSLLFLSVISRIWVLSKSTCIYMVTWYDSLQKCLNYLEPTQVVWLEDPGILPVSLGKWLEKFDRKTLTAERATAVMTELGTPCSNQMLEPESPQQAKTHGCVELDEDPKPVETTDQEEDYNDSDMIDEDLGCSVSRIDFAPKTNPKNKAMKTFGDQENVAKLSMKQAVKDLKLVTSLEDLLELVMKTDFQNNGDLHKHNCVKRLQHLMLISKKRKKQQDVAKFVRKGQISVRKFFMLTTRENEETSMIQDNLSKKHQKVVRLEEMETLQDVRKNLLNFKRCRSIFIHGRCVQIDDQQCANTIRTALRKCINRLKKNPDSAKQSINKALKVISSAVVQLQEVTACEIKGRKKMKKQKLESTLETGRVDKKKRKFEKGEAKTMDTNAERNIEKKERKSKKSNTMTVEANTKQNIEKKKRKKEIADGKTIGVNAGGKVEKRKADIAKTLPIETDKNTFRRTRRVSSMDNVDVIPRKKKKKKS
ncbi:uncharacterized protein LOC132565196 [Ylistrum balloti]|uniref:uncharacterized protein LOC132565196 n=1 Tax=Ylistrum balloti TaxID=509963 RepID=UPI002905A8A0|nr:uncharacterized protein LOC132565196 [Ylistrum balloti]